MWAALHVMSVASDSPAGVQRVLEGVREALPCPECRRHLDEYMRDNPPAFATNEAAATYLFRLHNAVNAHIGKPAFSPAAFLQAYGMEVTEAAGTTAAAPLPPPPQPQALRLLLPGVAITGPAPPPIRRRLLASLQAQAAPPPSSRRAPAFRLP
jgi:hypothetical protein